MKLSYNSRHIYFTLNKEYLFCSLLCLASIESLLTLKKEREREKKVEFKQAKEKKEILKSVHI